VIKLYLGFYSKNDPVHLFNSEETSEEFISFYKDYIDNIENSVNKEVVETIRNGVIGKLVDVSVEPAWTVTTDMETGEMKKSYYPNLNAPVEDETDAVENDESVEDEIGETVTDESGEDVEALYDYYNVRLTIEADMQYTGSSYSVGGYEIVVGHPVYFRIPQFVGSGYCIFLEGVE